MNCISSFQKSSWILVCSIVTILCGYTNVLGQNQTLIRISSTSDGSEQFEELMDNLKNSSEFYLARMIEDYDRACDLSDDQAKKLRVAAKGAIAKFVEKEREEKLPQLERYQQQAGVDPDDEDAVVRNLNFYMYTASSDRVAQHTLWAKAIEKVLDEKQMAAYKTVVDERDKFIRKAAVDRFVAKMEIALFLTIEQRNTVRPIIDEELGEFLTKYIKLEDQMRSRGAIRTIQNVEDSPIAEKFADFLTEEQIDQWKRKFEPLIDSLESDVQRAERIR